MSYNAELWSRTDKKSQRRTLINWLKSHRVEFSDDMTIEELRELYINIETGVIKCVQIKKNGDM